MACSALRRNFPGEPADFFDLRLRAGRRPRGGRVSSGDEWALPAFAGEPLAQSRTVFLIGSFGVIVTTSLLVGYLLNSYCRAASGSGIPQLKVAFWKDLE